jgi:prophage regulatory protein
MSDPCLISLNEACRLTSLSRTAINRWRDLGLFPAAVPLGDKRVAFVRSEVDNWIRDRISARHAQLCPGKTVAA